NKNSAIFAGGTWNREGSILFIGDGPSISRVRDLGGEIRKVISLGGASFLFPQFLPDGRHFLFFKRAIPAELNGVYVSDLDSSEPQQLLTADSNAIYAATGQLLFVRQGVVLAQDFDLERLKLSGNPFRVAEDVVVVGGVPALSV